MNHCFTVVLVSMIYNNLFRTRIHSFTYIMKKCLFLGLFKILWTYLNSWRLIFVDSGFFAILGDVILWKSRFSVSVRNISKLFLNFFFEDINLLRRATHEHHEHWATMNSNDFTLFCIFINTFITHVFLFVMLCFFFENLIKLFIFVWWLRPMYFLQKSRFLLIRFCNCFMNYFKSFRLCFWYKSLYKGISESLLNF